MSPRLYTAAEVMAHVAHARAEGFRAGVTHSCEVVELLERRGAAPGAIAAWLGATVAAVPEDVEPREVTAQLAVLKSGG